VVSDEKQYEFVSEQVRYHNEKIIESFNFFIQLFSAVVGGCIWLSIQKDQNAKFPSYQTLSNAIVVIVAIVAVIRIAENLRAWHGYRSAQCRLEPSIPKPRPLRASAVEMIMILGIVVAAGLFYIFNPFALQLGSK
jgi:hypothetical protein